MPAPPRPQTYTVLRPTWPSAVQKYPLRGTAERGTSGDNN